MKKQTITKRLGTALLFALFASALVLPLASTAHAATGTTTPSATASAGVSNASSTAQGFVPLTHLPAIQDASKAATLPSFLNSLYKICIGLAAVLAVLMIMLAGVEIMTSRGSVSSNEKAKSRIQNAILGLILVLSPVIVFGIINPDILKLDIDLSGLQPSALTHVDTVSQGSDLSQQICSSITTKKIIDIAPNQDAATMCSAIGKGYAHYDNTCCSITDTSHACCGYDPKNDQNTPAPPTPESQAGNYTFDWYLRSQDYVDKDNGYCLMTHTQHYTTQQACTAALTSFKSSNGGNLYAVSDNCDGDTTLGPITPKSTYDQISGLHTCEE